LDPAERTLGAALDLVAPQFAALMERDPELSSLFESADLTPEAFAGGARDLVESYFALEDPQLVQPVASELLIEAPLADGPLLRGYVDRLDPADSTGNLKIVDYKTGRSPAPRFANEMLFQLRFYALVLELDGRGVTMVELLYLGNRDVVRAAPTAGELARTRLRIETIWASIQRMVAAQDFPPVKQPLCNWCSFQSLCPAFGGTTPPFPST
ncbi:MAG: PD-(D/E)XK nuclease family protein, partial [Bifidobacteriaceae bacterium]|nr:PD-(D/E)XK nuclease family protein [Bifidobacteriaceae bacterium]